MPLVKNNILLSFAQGIDTKVDRKQTVFGQLHDLQNVTFKSIGEFTKRNGYDSLTTNVLDGDKLLNQKGLATFGDELVSLTDSKLNSFSPALNKWVEKGDVSKVIPTSNPIVRNIYSQTNPDSLCIDSVNVYVWDDSRGGIRYTVTDEDNDSFFISELQVTATGERPKLATIGKIVYIFYIDGTDLKFRKINPVVPAVLETEVTAQSNVDAAKTYDTQSIGDKVFIAYESNVSGGELAFFSVDIDNTISSVISKVGESGSDAINVCTDAAQRFVVTYTDGTDVKTNIYVFDFNSEILAPTVIEIIASVTNLSCVETTTANYVVVYEVSAASVKDFKLRKNTFDSGGVVGTAADVLRSVGLQSNLFRQNSRTYMLAMHESQFQSTYFVIEDTGLVVAKTSQALGGAHRTKSVAEVTALGSGKFQVASNIKSRLISEDNQFFTTVGVQSTIFDFEALTRFQKASMANNLHISGGFMQMYDGFNIVEHGFHIFPEDLSEQANATTGGFLVDGTYNYIALYNWTDNQGLSHLSSPSLGFAATTSAGGSTQTLTIRVPTLRVTGKTNLTIDLYRTVLAGTLFHKVTTIASPVVNDTALDFVDIVDGIADTALIANELLYTTGGILENIAPPSIKLMAPFGNRMMLVSGDRPDSLQFSKINFEGLPMEFSDLLVRKVARDEEPITTIAALDDKFIIFKNTSCYFIAGEGPNNAGQQDTFTEPEIISAEIGCSEPESIVLTPNGLMFKSNKGIYLLTRGLKTFYIGAPVEDFNDRTITSAIMIPDTNQVRFTISKDVCLVYDFFVNQWATFTNHSGEDAVILNNEYHYLNSFNTVFKENTSSFTDAGVPINIALETSWISFAGFQGYQRVYKFMGVGEYKSPHKLRIKIAYDFIEAFIHEKVIDTADFTDDDRYGEESPYGDGTPYGGDGNQYQFRVDLKKQKSQSIKIRIEEVQETELGEGLALSALTFQIGSKSGLFATDEDRKFGTQGSS